MRRRARFAGGVAVAVVVATACIVSASILRAGTKGTVTIVFWDQASSAQETKANDIINRAYQKLHPNVRIERRVFPYDVFNIKLRTAVATRSGPDLAAAFPGAFGATNYKQGMVPLNSYIAKIPAAERKNIRLLNTAAAPDGKVYAVPVGEYAYILEYNKKLFSQVGLDPAHPPTTYQQLLAACSKFRAAGITPIATGWKDGGTLEWYFYVLGEQLLSKSDFAKWQRMRLPMTAQPFRSLFSTVVQLQAKGCFDKTAIGLDTFNDPPAQFNSGKAAMFLFYLPPDPATVQKNFGDASALGLMPFPKLADAKWPYPSTDAGPANGIAMMNWSKHQKEAWDYVRYLLSPKAQLVQWNVTGKFPNNTAAKAKPHDQYQRAFLRILNNPWNHTLFLNFPVSVVQVLYKQAQPLLQENLSVDGFLQQLESTRKDAAAYWGQ